MKKAILTVIMGAFLVPSAFAKIDYFMADGLKVSNVRYLNTTKTTLDLSYNLPCWAEYVGVVKKTVNADQFSPLGGFETVLGVLLRGNSKTPCSGIIKETIMIEENTFAAEGKFRGFKLIGR